MCLELHSCGKACINVRSCTGDEKLKKCDCETNGHSQNGEQQQQMRQRAYEYDLFLLQIAQRVAVLFDRRWGGHTHTKGKGID